MEEDLYLSEIDYYKAFMQFISKREALQLKDEEINDDFIMEYAYLLWVQNAKVSCEDFFFNPKKYAEKISQKYGDVAKNAVLYIEKNEELYECLDFYLLFNVE